MGGTSTDVGLIEDAVPQVSGELELEYAMPIHVPMVDVHTIGAGGGSIASVDAAGMLRVGPESAGARPGPICYGRGGTEPTITDANLVLGRLNPERLLGVDHPVTLDHVRALVEEKVGRRLGLDAEAAAAAILRVANDRMAGAIRLVSLSRGHDPRDFALFAFGGAGPLHATALARELSIPTVLVPARPGITNALGCVVADLRHDYVRTVNKPLSAIDDAAIAAIYAEQAAEGKTTIQKEGVPIRELRRVLSADMQFQGQSHILSVGVESADIGVEGLRNGLCRGLLAPLRHRAAGDPAGAGQSSYRRHRRPAGDLAGRAGVDRTRAHAQGRPGRRTARLVHRCLVADADLRPRQAAARCGVRWARHPRAARLHDRHRAGRRGHPGQARESVDQYLSGQQTPHPEEHREAMRLEGCEPSLAAAHPSRRRYAPPQGEVAMVSGGNK